MNILTTGLEDNKFGINESEFGQVVDILSQSTHLKCIGLHFHIGSQITDMNVYSRLAHAVNTINEWFIDRGLDISTINLGGGLGIDYERPDENPIPDFKSYFGTFSKYLKLHPHQQIHFELGRSVT